MMLMLKLQYFGHLMQRVNSLEKTLMLGGRLPIPVFLGFACSSAGKESSRNAGDQDLIPRLGRYPGEGDGNPLQYSCLENPMDREAWQATVRRVAKSWTQLKQVSVHAYIYTINKILYYASWWLR